jgi:hypothetical protein
VRVDDASSLMKLLLDLTLAFDSRLHFVCLVEIDACHSAVALLEALLYDFLLLSFLCVDVLLLQVLCELCGVLSSSCTLS